MAEDRERTYICHKSDIVSFASKYDLREYIHCSIKGCNQPHKRGYNAMLTNGRQARIGNTCGKRLLGSDVFVRMQRDLEAKEQIELRQRLISSPGFDPAGAEALLAPWDKRVREIRQMLGELKASTHNLYAVMQQSSEKNDGRIVYEDWDYRSHAFTVQGRRFLANPVWDDYFDLARTNVKRVIELLEKQMLNERELKNIISKTSQANRYLKLTADVLDDFRGFCTVGNLTGVAKWFEVALDARSYTPVSVKLLDEGTHIVLRARGSILLSVPKHTTDIDRSPLTKLSPL